MVFCLNQRAAACPATRLYIYMGYATITAPDPLVVLCHGCELLCYTVLLHNGKLCNGRITKMELELTSLALMKGVHSDVLQQQSLS